MAWLRLGTIYLTAALMLLGCGYHLRGYNQQGWTQTNVTTPKPIRLDFSDGSYNAELERLLSQKLRALGMQHISSSQTIQKIAEENTNTPHQVQIKTLEFRQFKLVGVLNEIRTTLNAQVNYRLRDTHGDVKIHNDTLQVTSSYQYNEAAIGSNDAQNTQVRRALLEALATRIAEQYYSLSQP